MAEKLPEPRVPDDVVTVRASVTDTARQIEVDSQPALAVATDLLIKIRAAKDQAERARTFLVKPLNDHVKSINATFKPEREALEAAEREVKGKIAAYHREREEEARRRAEEEAEAVRQAAEFLDMTEQAEEAVARIEESASVSKASYTMQGSSGVAKRWTYDVTDLRALCAAIGRGELPVDLVEPNRGALNRMATNAELRAAYAKLTGEIAARDCGPSWSQERVDEHVQSVTGLRVYQVDNVTVRSN
jgi:hypothetical protein